MDLHPKQLTRIDVAMIQADGCERVVNRHFCVDPQTITLQRLRHLVARALHLKEEFSLSILRSDQSAPFTLEGEWDLEGALSEEKRMELVLRLHPKEPELEEWDIICPSDVIPLEPPPPRKGSFLDQVFQRSTSVLSEPEFLSVCDWPCPLRHATYRAGGADHALRPALWMHLLDVYPHGATPTEREEFLNRKAEEYYGLRHSWQKLMQDGTVPTSLRDVTCLIRKDVRRTDRHLPVPPDARALYNVLTTFAFHHPSIGYRQGMSDLLSPLLHVMRTEAKAYVALCALMRRMRGNFCGDGRRMRTQFAHLRRAVRAHDPRLHAHLRRVGATHLLFCYRWLLLDLKREFPYHEMLTLTEVLWSTLSPLEGSKGGVRLAEDGPLRTCTAQSSSDEEDVPTTQHPRRSKRSKRRHSISNSWRDSSAERHSRTTHEMRIDGWLEEESNPRARIRLGSSDSNYGSNFSDEEPQQLTASDEDEQQNTSRSEGYTSGTATSSDEDERSSSLDDSDRDDDPCRLPMPPPTRFGDGKPFLVFLCLSMILNHRDAILEMDANEIGVHFDRLVRRHRISEVLPRARELFAEYLRSGWTDDD